MDEDEIICRWCGTQVQHHTKIDKKNRKPSKRLRVGVGILATALIGIFLFYQGLSFFDREKIKIVQNVPDNNSVEEVIDEETNPTEIPTPTDTLAPTDKKVDNLFYVKQGRIYSGKVEHFSPYVAINNLYRDGDAYEIFLESEDGSKIFYPQNHDQDEAARNIFSYTLNSSQGERRRIDTEITGYTTNYDGSIFYYLKGNDLYVSDKTNTSRVAFNVNNCVINKKGDRVVYSTADGAMYQMQMQPNKTTAQKIADNAMITYISLDLNVIYYIQAGNLYLFKDGNKTEKIAPNVSHVVYVYEKSGTVYYYKQDKLQVSDFIEDDKYETDLNMKEPLRENFKSDESYSEYQKEYEKKILRDNIRNNSAYNFVGGYSPWSSLYCYSGGKEKLVSKNCLTIWGVNNQSMDMRYGMGSEIAKPYMLFSKSNTFKKIKISELSSSDDINTLITSQVYNKQEYYLYSEDEAILKVGDGNMSNFVFNEDQSGFYYLKISAKQPMYGELYYTPIENDKLGESKKIAENVYDGVLTPQGNSVLYFKNISEESMIGDMYIDGTKIDNNISVYQFNEQRTQMDSLIYEKQYSKNSDFTLKLYENGESRIIADNVTSYQLFDKNRVAYIKNYVNGEDKKDLFLYDGKNQLLDSNVDKLVIPAKTYYYLVPGMYNYFY